MATRGAKPKPVHLRVVDGTHRNNRHGDIGKAREAAEGAVEKFGKLTRPKGFRGEALSAWRKYIEPAGWLDGSKEPAAIAFCELWQEFRMAPNLFTAARHGQLRAYMSELGLTDERNRSEEEEKPDEFFS